MRGKSMGRTAALSGIFPAGLEEDGDAVFRCRNSRLHSFSRRKQIQGAVIFRMYGAGAQTRKTRIRRYRWLRIPPSGFPAVVAEPDGKRERCAD